MRNAFIDELVSQAIQNDRIALIVGDLGYSVVEPFAEKFPDRFINAGVAEQNMMGLAAGMASEGYQVFVYSIANFPTFRCAEQIRNDIAYHNLPVTVVSVGGGVSYGNAGYSHHAVQDYGLMRMFPNMLIAAPGDPFEVKASLGYILKNPQPAYLRLGKAGEKKLNKFIPIITPGIWNNINNHSNLKKAVITTGNGLQIVSEWRTQGLYQEYDLYSMPLWGMGHKSLQPAQIKKYEKILTVEDHLIDAGFGSWILESLINFPELLTRVEIKALNSNICGLAAGQSMLQKIGFV